MAKQSKSKSSPAQQESSSKLLSLASISSKERAKILDSLTPQQLIDLRWDWRFWARPEQLPPEGDWRSWVIVAGRGFGKTRTGAEFVRDQVKNKSARRIALVGRTAADVRDVMVTGPSGLLAVHPDHERPLYEPSRRRLTWPCGATAHTYTSERSDQLRGPQHDLAWCDELAAWSYPYDTWDQLMFGLRLGNPRCVVTTTPRPIKLLKDLLENPSCAITRGSTFDNKLNLAKAFFDQIIDKYEGTTIGRQEIYADMLTEVPGALWKRSMIDDHRVHQPPATLKRVVVGVDPAVTNKDTSDETGIIVVGLGSDDHFYVLGDGSVKASVDTWARAVVTRYNMHRADKVIAEVNQGGDLVARMINQIDSTVPIKKVHASRGKVLRAEPVAARYEQGRVHHVGALNELEDQLCSYSPMNSKISPDRMDALVYAITELDSKNTIDLKIDSNANYQPRNFF